MKIRKAVITAAGKGTRQYPATQAIQKEMIPLVDRDGLTRPTIHIMIEEVLRSGIEEVGIIIAPEDEPAFRGYFRGLDAGMRRRFAGKPWGLAESDRLEEIGRRLTLIPQAQQEGYGHAVWCAKEWVDSEPFLLLLGDHVYLSRTDITTMRQVLDVAERHDSSVFSVHRKPEECLHLYGTVAGDPLEGEAGVYRITRVQEKPDVETARAHFRVAGLDAGDYLCFFGMYALAPAIFDCLDDLIAQGRRERGEFQFTSAQAMLVERAPTLACEVHGDAYDIGIPLGLLETQIALGLRGKYGAEARAFIRTIEGGGAPDPR